MANVSALILSTRAITAQSLEDAAMAPTSTLPLTSVSKETSLTADLMLISLVRV